MKSTSRRGRPISPFIFNFQTEVALKIPLSSCEDSGIAIFPGSKLSDLEHEGVLHPQKCIMPLQDLNWLEMELGSCERRTGRSFAIWAVVSPGGLISDERAWRIYKSRLVFANLRHLYLRGDTRLMIIGPVCTAAARSIMPFGAEAWPLRTRCTKAVDSSILISS